MADVVSNSFASLNERLLFIVSIGESMTFYGGYIYIEGNCLTNFTFGLYMYCPSLPLQLLCVTVRGSPMRTSQLLCEHAEKIVAATALMKTHNQ